MRIERVHARSHDGDVAQAEAQAGPQRRAQIAAVRDLTEHDVRPVGIQRGLVFFKHQRGEAVVLLRFAAKHAIGELLAHAQRLTLFTQERNALVAQSVRVQKQPPHALGARLEQIQAREHAQRIAVIQPAAVWLQLGHRQTLHFISILSKNIVYNESARLAIVFLEIAAMGTIQSAFFPRVISSRALLTLSSKHGILYFVLM